MSGPCMEQPKSNGKLTPSGLARVRALAEALSSGAVCTEGAHNNNGYGCSAVFYLRGKKKVQTDLTFTVRHCSANMPCTQNCKSEP